jgi:hypothetical protein
MKPPKLHNLELHKKINGKWQHSSTVVWNSPYSLCKGEKTKREANKSHFEFYKIVPS